jgi:hypothetical protein
MKEQFLTTELKQDPNVKASLDLIFTDVMKGSNTTPQSCNLDKRKSELAVLLSYL